MLCLNKQTLTLLVVTTTVTHTPEETKKELEETLVAKAAAVEKIAQMILQLPNCCLTEICEMGAYTRSLSPNAHIEPHNSKKSTTLYK